MKNRTQLKQAQRDELHRFAAESTSESAVKKAMAIILQDELSSEQVAKALGWRSSSYCRLLRSQYMSPLGLESLRDKRKTGGVRSLSLGVEESVIQGIQATPEGDVPLAGIHLALNSAAGKQLDQSSVRRILYRHGWIRSRKGHYRKGP
jgi:hypothetical protein